MLKYVLKRLGYMVLSLFIIITITFFLMKLMPGSPFNDQKLNDEQKNAYEKVCKSVYNQEVKIFSLDAPGGTGKTFIINL